jgi:hypothetical protein
VHRHADQPAHRYLRRTPNTRVAADYGTARGGTPISFGFKTDNLTGVREWLLDTLGGRANPDQFKTKAANALYNVNQVSWNPASQRTGFLEGDVALPRSIRPRPNPDLGAAVFRPARACIDQQ